jgi:hypothetical protein
MDHSSFRYQITGSMATGFALVDTATGTIIEHFRERLDANRGYADANRAWHRHGIAAEPAARRRRANIGNSSAAGMIDPLYRLRHLEARHICQPGIVCIPETN